MTKEVYVNNGLSLLLNNSGSEDYGFSVENIANSTGQISDQIDLGPAPRPYVNQWSCEVQFQATPTSDVGLDLYYATAPDGDATQIDGNIGNADAAFSDEDTLKNLTYFGSVLSEDGVASEVLVGSGELSITARYLSIVAFNKSGATVNATAANFRFNIQPKFSQGQ